MSTWFQIKYFLVSDQPQVMTTHKARFATTVFRDSSQNDWNVAILNGPAFHHMCHPEAITVTTYQLYPQEKFILCTFMTEFLHPYVS